ncbi:hypothetical protein [Parasporobacterium paucivorans]|uniref:Lipoprotein n=1 Tax=Parasporobacterium paucivorans DSM 15970 TaxID=1122934 RepID=A0A1M6FL43_9FIRM|nr:hypothetical protein [Parasporobacterium paucivorans]SHI98376.1 hypothetical protein SAMN02745691_01137 [Parasporobacterium paucivorans DSM 15970]
MKYAKICLILLGVLVFSMGCSGLKGYGFKTEETLTYIKQDDSIISIFVEDFDKSVYSEKELKEAVTKEIEEYDQTAAEGAGVSMVDLYTSGGSAYLELQYKTVEDYCAYNSRYTYNGKAIAMSLSKASEIQPDTFQPDELFIEHLDGGAMKDISFAEMDTSDTLKVLVTNEGMTFRVDGKIRYTSSNVAVNDEVIKTTADENNYIFYE